MAFCTRCGQQTDGGQRTAGGAELCLFCGAGPEVHHGYPGRRVSRHAGPADVYAYQDGGAGRTSACRVPLSDYPSLTDLPAIAGTWPTASYSSRSRSGRHALPPEPALLRRTVTAQLALRPGPPEFQDEQLAAVPFALPYSLPEPRPSHLPEAEHAGPAGHRTLTGELGPAGDPGAQTLLGPGDHPMLVRATARRALTAARGSRWVSVAAAGLVVFVGAATAAIAMAGHDPIASSQDAAGAMSLGPDGGAAASTSLVRPAAAVAGAAHETRILSLLDRYFGAINTHHFRAYQRLFRSTLRGALPKTAVTGATDSDAILRGITPISAFRLTAQVTFTSHEQPALSPTSSSCTDWTVRLYLAHVGHRYLLAKPPASYQPSARSCR